MNRCLPRRKVSRFPCATQGVLPPSDGTAREPSRKPQEGALKTATQLSKAPASILAGGLARAFEDEKDA